VWAQFMRAGWRSPDSDRAWAAPPSLEARTIDRTTGLLASDWCGGEPQLEWFKAGTAPTESCDGGWFRFTGGLGELPGDAIDAAVEALGEALGEGKMRQSLLRKLGAEMKRQVVPEPPREPPRPAPPRPRPPR